ncbi:MAG: DNA-binding protein WhiA [Desulfotomaculales bacterium]
MSFSLSTKNELARVCEKKRCCQLAELAALIKVSGVLKISGDKKTTLNLFTENAAVARKVFLLAKELFRVSADVTVRRNVRFKKNNVYLVSIGGQTEEILRETGLLTGGGNFQEGIDRELLRRECCRRAYLRGIFLGGGSVADPGSGYHLEITVNTKNYAKEIFRFLHKMSFQPGWAVRKNGYALYLKEVEQIVNCLGMMGAHAAVLHLENVRVYRQMRNQVNRQVNCETANLAKTVNASLQQQETILFLVSAVGLEKLPAPLRQVAEARLAHPDASLRELGEMLTPKISKSGVKHRLRRLEEIARLLPGEKGGRP